MRLLLIIIILNYFIIKFLLNHFLKMIGATLIGQVSEWFHLGSAPFKLDLAEPPLSRLAVSLRNDIAPHLPGFFHVVQLAHFYLGPELEQCAIFVSINWKQSTNKSVKWTGTGQCHLVLETTCSQARLKASRSLFTCSCSLNWHLRTEYSRKASQTLR